MMGQGDINVWTNWVHEETDVTMSQLEEELEAQGDPDDPFNGTANGVFNLYRGTYCHCHLWYKHPEDKEISANIMNLRKIHQETGNNLK